jgi:hypothetical protein
LSDLRGSAARLIPRRRRYLFRRFGRLGNFDLRVLWADRPAPTIPATRMGYSGAPTGAIFLQVVEWGDERQLAAAFFASATARSLSVAPTRNADGSRWQNARSWDSWWLNNSQKRVK